MSIIITSPLKKSLSKISPSSAGSETVNAEIIGFIQTQTHDIEKLISQFENNIDILSLQKDHCTNISAILEEAGGLTVRARHLVTIPQDAEKHHDKIKDLENLFITTLSKLDKYVSSATDGGINLLNGGNLETKFDNKGEHSLTTNGICLDSKNLGIRTPDFSTLLNVQNSRIDVMNAIDMAVTLRNTISSDISALKSSLSLSISTIDNAHSAVISLNAENPSVEHHRIQNLDISTAIGNDPLAEPPQQDILNSFAASPNMEDI